MLSPAGTSTELVIGERIAAKEFLRRWDGIVCVPASLSLEQGSRDTAKMWLAQTAGLAAERHQKFVDRLASVK